MNAKRSQCEACQRPPQRCLCAYIEPTDNYCPIVLLQHPKEHGHPKNTGELLVRSLSNATLLQGEQFTPQSLSPWLQGAALLYPTEPNDNGSTTRQIPYTQPPSCLIVLDATWRKSHKMLQLNPALQRLPRLALTAQYSSLYRIRSARDQHQLSTLEASCYALQQIESNSDKYRPLLEQFAQYMTHLADFDPNR
ncbi:DTW domain-containing protein [Gilvimarinus agarilyticus]|uniref:tRNA-uridine aminocarboxypropyltransferase n=1 Tax=unclassified Gilvimarinus TaxID=2642066 RepID=UPI001C08CDF4|nr:MULTISPECIES: tRNA-uridine aminocarboxypropyltransferase [unclassified Gilvimarinus]MBU2887018.1 DTW domain-containing protein [Gilvimarinus agarilyticus]MDO6571678.1 tRNA-uridine aminocarboxypropyltransferase [Gilvimarinus sp. 2_MG-2023]MDO6745750.1 tRNA-uridine aminocarboxypropyltransferase [Gilvimarinus sp. 1_MG-2023]